MMKSLHFLCYLFAVSPLVAQTDESGLPPKLKMLQENYEAALFRAKEPVIKTYIKELEKLKIEYTRAGDLKLAVSTDELIKQAEESLDGPKDSLKLAEMNDRQFKKWLSTVVITEIASPKFVEYTFENEVINTMYADLRAPRVHQNATVELGRLIVPFTDSVATITINPNLNQARVAYSNGTFYEAKISEKKRR